MGRGHNLVSIILYDERRVRPDTLQAIVDAVRGGKNGAVIPCDPATMGSFQQLIFFEPDVGEILEQKIGTKETAAHRRKREAQERTDAANANE